MLIILAGANIDSNVIQQPVSVMQTSSPVHVESTFNTVQVPRHSLYPVMKFVQPSVTLATHQIPVFKYRQMLRPVPYSIPILTV